MDLLRPPPGFSSKRHLYQNLLVSLGFSPHWNKKRTHGLFIQVLSNGFGIAGVVGLQTEYLGFAQEAVTKNRTCSLIDLSERPFTRKKAT